MEVSPRCQKSPRLALWIKYRAVGASVLEEAEVQNMDTDARVKRVLSKALIVDDKLILDSALLVEDLGVTSLDRFELLMSLEEVFGIEISEQDLEGVKTVADVVSCVERKTQS